MNSTKECDVLIVDDDPDICEIFRLICIKDGAVPVTAYNLTEAGKTIDCRPAIAFVDYNLPDGLGTTFVPMLKNKLSDVYIVVMTAQPSPQVANEAYNCGANSFLPKPFDIEAVVRLITDHKKD